MSDLTFVGGQGEFEDSLGLLESLVASGLLGLALEGADLAPNLAEHVVHSNEVLLGRLHLALGLAAACLVLPDPGGFLDQPAAILGFGGHDLGNLPLLDDRVAAQADPRVTEEVVNILQPGRLLVHQVLGLARAVEPTSDFDLGVRGVGGGRLSVRIVEAKSHLGHADRRSILRPGKDDVVHPLAAQFASRLLAHHPLDGIHDVGFAAAVWPDHRSHAVIEAEDGAIDEGFESVELQTLDAQGTPISLARWSQRTSSAGAGSSFPAFPPANSSRTTPLTGRVWGTPPGAALHPQL